LNFNVLVSRTGQLTLKKTDRCLPGVGWTSWCAPGMGVN